MSRRISVVTNYSGGEFSPLFAGRYDIPNYNHAVETCQNMIPLPGGAITKRPGTKYLDTIPLSSFYDGNDDWDSILLIECFSTLTNTPVLASFGRGFLKTWRLDTGALISSHETPAAIFKGTSDWAQVGAYVIIARSNGQPVRFHVNTTSISLELFEPQIPFWRTTRLYKTNDFVKIHDGVNMQYCTCTADVTVFPSTFPGDYPWNDTAHWSSTTVYDEATMRPKYDPFYGANNYPKLVTEFEGRVIFASTAADPATIWAESLIETSTYNDGVFSGINISQYDGDNYSYEINGISDINWIEPRHNVLILGAPDREVKLYGGDLGITYANVIARHQTHFGSLPVKPRSIGPNIFFCEASRIRSYFWQDENAAFNSVDMNTFASHVFNDGSPVKEFTYVEKPYPILWAIKENGKLIGCTLDAQSNTVAWHSHVIGSNWALVTVESICSVRMDIPPYNDRVYMVCKREDMSGGGFNYQIEYMEGPDLEKTAYTACYLDGSMPLATSSTQLTHANYAFGILDFLIDGNYLGTSGGDGSGVFIYPESETCQTAGFAGFKYPCTVKSLPIGGSFTKKKLNAINLRFYKSYGLTLAYDPDMQKGEAVSFEDVQSDEFDYIQFYTGWKGVDHLGDFQDDQFLWFYTDTPWPMNILQTEYILEENIT